MIKRYATASHLRPASSGPVTAAVARSVPADGGSRVAPPITFAAPPNALDAAAGNGQWSARRTTSAIAVCRRLRLPRFESWTCHHLRKRPVAWDFARRAGHRAPGHPGFIGLG